MDNISNFGMIESELSQAMASIMNSNMDSFNLKTMDIWN